MVVERYAGDRLQQVGSADRFKATLTQRRTPQGTTAGAAGSGGSICFSHFATTALATELPTTLVAERPM